MASVRPAYRQVQKYVGYVLFLVGPAAVVCRVVLCARMHHEGHVRDAETAPGLTDDAYNRVQMSRWENLWGTETVANSKGKRKAETHAVNPSSGKKPPWIDATGAYIHSNLWAPL